MILLLVIMCIYQALCLFLLAMPKYTKVLGREFKPSERQSKMRRAGGWLLIVVSSCFASVEMGVVNALVFMLGTLTFTGTCLALMFQYFPRQALRPIIPVGQFISWQTWLFLTVQLSCALLLIKM